VVVLKISNAIALGREGKRMDVEVRISPSDQCQWFVMVRDSDHKSFILTDDENTPIALNDLDSISDLIQSIGAKEFKVFL